MKLREIFWPIWYTTLYKLNRLPKSEVYRRALNFMRKFSALEMIEILDHVFEGAILPRLYCGGIEVLRKHKEEGHLTVIVTAAWDYVAERARVQLGADEYIATPIPIEGDRATDELEDPAVFGRDKLEIAWEFTSFKGADLRVRPRVPPDMMHQLILQHRVHGTGSVSLEVQGNVEEPQLFQLAYDHLPGTAFD